MQRGKYYQEMITPEKFGLKSRDIEYLEVEQEIPERRLHIYVRFKNGEYKEWHYKAQEIKK